MPSVGILGGDWCVDDQPLAAGRHLDLPEVLMDMLRISAKVAGVAPATPSSARAAISISALVEKVAMTEAEPNATARLRSSRRRPIRTGACPS